MADPIPHRGPPFPERTRPAPPSPGDLVCLTSSPGEAPVVGVVTLVERPWTVTLFGVAAELRDRDVSAVLVEREYHPDRLDVLARRGTMPAALLAAVEVLAERERQVAAEGYTAAHDDFHDDGEIAQAAAAYALASARLSSEARPAFVAGEPDRFSVAEPVEIWPWEPSGFKPADRRRALVKALALGFAELERIDRQDAALAAVASGGAS